MSTGSRARPSSNFFWYNLIAPIHGASFQCLGPVSSGCGAQSFLVNFQQDGRRKHARYQRSARRSRR